jgi:TRAP-type C4-dicarboxylate transport system substrate-binding protein
LPDVLPALQTGAIQACAAPPLAAIALQWHSHLRFMTDRPPSYAVGAMVIRSDVLARLRPADRELLLTGGRALGAQLTASVRRDNERAVRAMVKEGIVVVHVPDDVQARLVAAGKEVRARLAGKLYSKDLLARIEALTISGYTPPPAPSRQ